MVLDLEDAVSADAEDLDRPRDIIDTRRLLARPHQASADELRDESVRLKRLAPPDAPVVSTP
ncbi:hypothetical protein [Amycolatopsis rubida]|uniref:hypothetical protein n=1 Tax=Amycolatopsis rubida TaxID=112413 RepID=UPI001AD81126